MPADEKYVGLDELETIKPGETKLCDVGSDFLSEYSKATIFETEARSLAPATKELKQHMQNVLYPLEKEISNLQQRIMRLKNKRAAIMILAWEALRESNEIIDRELLQNEVTVSIRRDYSGIPIFVSAPRVETQDGLPAFLSKLRGLMPRDDDNGEFDNDE